MEMKAQHIGLYWNRIRDRYPLLRAATPHNRHQPIRHAAHYKKTPGELFPLPRFWFSSATHPMLIQVQRNAFIFNWRRGDANEYPHYDTVVKDFWQELESYKAFIQELGPISLDVIQQSKAYLISTLSPPNEVFANPAQLMNVLPPIASLYDIQTDNRQMAGINATVNYRVNPTLMIDLAIKLGRRLRYK